MAKTIDIVTVASPSAAKVWAERAGTNFIIVSIGSSTDAAVKKLGFRRSFCPTRGVSNSNLEAFADLIAKVSQSAE